MRGLWPFCLGFSLRLADRESGHHFCLTGKLLHGTPRIAGRDQFVSGPACAQCCANCQGTPWSLVLPRGCLCMMGEGRVLLAPAKPRQPPTGLSCQVLVAPMAASRAFYVGNPLHTVISRSAAEYICPGASHLSESQDFILPSTPMDASLLAVFNILFH